MPHNQPQTFNSWDALKILGLLLMFVDHAGAFFYTDVEHQWLRAIGRGAAPIFMFLAGYASSYRFKWDLFFLGVLMSVSDLALAGHLRTQNILFTILLTRMFFAWVERQQAERSKRIINSPWQWAVGSAVWFFTMALFQYGTLCLMYGICGYVKKRTDQYQQVQFNAVLLLTVVFYILITQLTFLMTWPNFILTALVCSIVGYLMWIMELKPVNTSRLPGSLVWLLKQMSVYSGYIYALHLIAVEWISGIPF